MHSGTFLVLIFLFLLSVFGAQPKRVADQMYISFDRTRYCVRRLNGTHEIGCQSSLRGNSGRMYMIDNDTEFNSYLSNKKLIDSSGSFIIVLNVDLFDTNHVDKLMSSLDSKLNGILLYIKPNSSRPDYFSHDDQCPNRRQSFYLNKTETINWNPKGTGLFFRSFPFPMMLIDEEDDYEKLVKFYQKFNHDESKPKCGLELSVFQSAAHTSKTCMRRGTIEHSILDGAETLCDPVGGQNIYSKLPQSLTVVPKVRQPKSVVLILAATDGFQMFLKGQSRTGGAQQPATGLITFLALAHLIGQAQNEFNQQDKEIIFVTLDGDALDYSASFKFMYDMVNGNFPTGNKNEQPINVEHIHSIIEFQSLSLTNNISLYAHPLSLTNKTFIDTLVQNNPMLIPMTTDSILPPASSQIFLRQTSSSSFPAYIFTSTDQNQLSNHYYHSFFDDLSTLSINASSLEYDSTTKFSEWIKSVVEPLAQTLIETFAGVKSNITIDQVIINNLVYCVLKNINCNLIHNVTNDTTGSSFEPFNGTSLPFSINTYPTSTTPTFPFVKYILSYFLRDREFDTRNLTKETCLEFAQNDSLRSYIYVDGCKPSIISEESFPGYCVRSYFRTIESTSPAFNIDNYDLADTTYPAWTESRWSTITLRLFIIPTKKHEIITLVVGLLLLVISFIVCLILRFFTKFSLVQPSSS